MVTRSTAEVEFHGGRSRVAPLAWGQQRTWDLIGDWDRAKTFAVVGRWLDIPLLLSLSDVLEQLGELMRRHEVLRTLYHPTADGSATQDVVAEGSLTVDVFSRPPDDPQDFGDIVRHCLREAVETGFDHEKELPIRFSVIMHEEIPVLLTFAVSHVSADFVSLNVLVADLRALLCARADGKPMPPTRPAQQPADLAAFERLPEGQLRSIEAMRYIRTQLTMATADLLPARATPLRPRFHRGGLDSNALAAALHLAARRYRTTTSVLLLSITTALVRSFCPGPVYPVDIMQSNRTTPDLLGTVSNLAQAVVAMVDLNADSFAELVGHCARAMAETRRHGRHDARAARELLGAADFVPGCQLNDLWSALPRRSPSSRLTSDDLARLADTTTFSWPETSDSKDKVLFVGTQGTADRIHLSLYADTALLPPGDIRAFLFAFEQVTITLAFEDIPLDDITKLFAQNRG